MKRSSCNSEGKTPMYCKTHKTEGMINVVEKRKCIAKDCNTRPYYNMEGKTIGIEKSNTILCR